VTDEHLLIPRWAPESLTKKHEPHKELIGEIESGGHRGQQKRETAGIRTTGGTPICATFTITGASIEH